MNPEFWHDRWRAGQIGFHRLDIDGNLLRHWPALDLPQAARVLVPLCGKSRDLGWLLGRGHEVVGIDLSPLALQAFLMENGIAARRRATRLGDRFEAPRLALIAGDFFDVETADLGWPEAVFDRAALVAGPPEWRARYATRLTMLTRAGTEMLLVTLEYPAEERSGPPFSVEADEVHALYGTTHVIRELERRDILAEEPRMRARGVTRLAEVCYRLTRL